MLLAVCRTAGAAVAAACCMLLNFHAQKRLRRSPSAKCKHKYVGPCTRATEGSDLDQVLSCLRKNSS